MLYDINSFSPDGKNFLSVIEKGEMMQQGMNKSFAGAGLSGDFRIAPLSDDEIDMIAAGSLVESMLIGAGAGGFVGSFGSPAGAAVGALIGAGVGAAAYYLP